VSVVDKAQELPLYGGSIELARLHRLRDMLDEYVVLGSGYSRYGVGVLDLRNNINFSILHPFSPEARNGWVKDGLSELCKDMKADIGRDADLFSTYHPMLIKFSDVLDEMSSADQFRKTT